jgi:hypothetical protein
MISLEFPCRYDFVILTLIDCSNIKFIITFEKLDFRSNTTSILDAHQIHKV